VHRLRPRRPAWREAASLDVLQAAWLGLVQGLTEFLPVSSSGHLVLFSRLLGAEQEGILFEVAVHAATLLAVLLFYRSRVGELVLGTLRGDPNAWRYGLKLAVGTIPAVVAVLLARDFFEGLYESVAPVGLALWFTGFVVFSTRYTLPHARSPEPGWVAVIGIGIAQAIAIVPGISRSGSTVAAALALGVAPAAAAEFSFLLSVVAIVGAVILEIPELEDVSSEGLASIAVGGVAALVSGLAALALFVRLLRRHAFHWFAWYLWPVGALVLWWSLHG
jgi:undecaprenyl-diphosphatase